LDCGTTGRAVCFPIIYPENKKKEWKSLVPEPRREALILKHQAVIFSSPVNITTPNLHQSVIRMDSDHELPIRDGQIQSRNRHLRRGLLMLDTATADLAFIQGP
jgi:hypothetical protein